MAHITGGGLYENLPRIIRDGFCADVDKSSIEIPEIFKHIISKGVKEEEIIDYQAGLIPIYDKKSVINRGNVYLVGDAAGQVKATTGGGLVPGLKAAKILADCLINKKDYQKEIKKLNKKLWLHLKLREILNKFSNKDYDNLVKLMKKKKIDLLKN